MTVTPSSFEENLDKAQFSHPKGYVLETSRHKAIEVLARLKAEVNTFFLHLPCSILIFFIINLTLVTAFLE